MKRWASYHFVCPIYWCDVVQNKGRQGNSKRVEGGTPQCSQSLIYTHIHLPCWANRVRLEPEKHKKNTSRHLFVLIGQNQPCRLSYYRTGYNTLSPKSYWRTALPQGNRKHFQVYRLMQVPRWFQQHKNRLNLGTRQSFYRSLRNWETLWPVSRGGGNENLHLRTHSIDAQNEGHKVPIERM